MSNSNLIPTVSKGFEKAPPKPLPRTVFTFLKNNNNESEGKVTSTNDKSHDKQAPKIVRIKSKSESETCSFSVVEIVGEHNEDCASNVIENITTPEELHTNDEGNITVPNLSSRKIEDAKAISYSLISLPSLNDSTNTNSERNKDTYTTNLSFGKDQQHPLGNEESHFLESKENTNPNFKPRPSLSHLTGNTNKPNSHTETVQNESSFSDFSHDGKNSSDLYSPRAKSSKTNNIRVLDKDKDILRFDSTDFSAESAQITPKSPKITTPGNEERDTTNDNISNMATQDDSQILTTSATSSSSPPKSVFTFSLSIINLSRKLGIGPLRKYAKYNENRKRFNRNKSEESTASTSAIESDVPSFNRSNNSSGAVYSRSNSESTSESAREGTNTSTPRSVSRNNYVTSNSRVEANRRTTNRDSQTYGAVSPIDRSHRNRRTTPSRSGYEIRDPVYSNAGRNQPCTGAASFDIFRGTSRGIELHGETTVPTQQGLSSKKLRIQLKNLKDFRNVYGRITQTLTNGQELLLLNKYIQACSEFETVLKMIDNVLKVSVDTLHLSDLDKAMCKSIQDVALTTRKTALEGFSDAQAGIIHPKDIISTSTPQGAPPSYTDVLRQDIEDTFAVSPCSEESTINTSTSTAEGISFHRAQSMNENAIIDHIGSSENAHLLYDRRPSAPQLPVTDPPEFYVLTTEHSRNNLIRLDMPSNIYSTEAVNIPSSSEYSALSNMISNTEQMSHDIEVKPFSSQKGKTQPIFLPKETNKSIHKERKNFENIPNEATVLSGSNLTVLPLTTNKTPLYPDLPFDTGDSSENIKNDPELSRYQKRASILRDQDKRKSKTFDSSVKLNEPTTVQNSKSEECLPKHCYTSTASCIDFSFSQTIASSMSSTSRVHFYVESMMTEPIKTCHTSTVWSNSISNTTSSSTTYIPTIPYLPPVQSLSTKPQIPPKSLSKQVFPPDVRLDFQNKKRDMKKSSKTTTVTESTDNAKIREGNTSNEKHSTEFPKKYREAETNVINKKSFPKPAPRTKFQNSKKFKKEQFHAISPTHGTKKVVNDEFKLLVKNPTSNQSAFGSNSHGMSHDKDLKDCVHTNETDFQTVRKLPKSSDTREEIYVNADTIKGYMTSKQVSSSVTSTTQNDEPPVPTRDYKKYQSSKDMGKINQNVNKISNLQVKPRFSNFNNPFLSQNVFPSTNKSSSDDPFLTYNDHRSTYTEIRYGSNDDLITDDGKIDSKSMHCYIMKDPFAYDNPVNSLGKSLTTPDFEKTIKSQYLPMDGVKIKKTRSVENRLDSYVEFEPFKTPQSPRRSVLYEFDPFADKECEESDILENKNFVNEKALQIELTEKKFRTSDQVFFESSPCLEKELGSRSGLNVNTTNCDKNTSLKFSKENEKSNQEQMSSVDHDKPLLPVKSKSKGKHRSSSSSDGGTILAPAAPSVIVTPVQRKSLETSSFRPSSIKLSTFPDGESTLEPQVKSQSTSNLPVPVSTNTKVYTDENTVKIGRSEFYTKHNEIVAAPVKSTMWKEFLKIDDVKLFFIESVECVLTSSLRPTLHILEEIGRRGESKPAIRLTADDKEETTIWSRDLMPDSSTTIFKTISDVFIFSEKDGLYVGLKLSSKTVFPKSSKFLRLLKTYSKFDKEFLDINSNKDSSKVLKIFDEWVGERGEQIRKDVTRRSWKTIQFAKNTITNMTDQSTPGKVYEEPRTKKSVDGWENLQTVGRILEKSICERKITYF